MLPVCNSEAPINGKEEQVIEHMKPTTAMRHIYGTGAPFGKVIPPHIILGHQHLPLVISQVQLSRVALGLGLIFFVVLSYNFTL